MVTIELSASRTTAPWPRPKSWRLIVAEALRPVSFVEYPGAFLPVSGGVCRAKTQSQSHLTQKEPLPHNLAYHLSSSNLVLFRKNATANFVTIKWHVPSGSPSWSSMIFCHRNMAQNEKEIRSKTEQTKMVFMKRPWSTFRSHGSSIAMGRRMHSLALDVSFAHFRPIWHQQPRSIWLLCSPTFMIRSLTKCALHHLRHCYLR